MPGSAKSDGKKVAIIGGGIAGLTAAWALLSRGFDVTLYEERMHLGGKMGAHPARISLWRRPGEWSDDEARELGRYINPKLGAFKSERAANGFISQLTRGHVPRLVLDAVRHHYLGVLARLGIASPELTTWLQGGGLIDTLNNWPIRSKVVRELTRPGDLVGARRKWQVSYPKVKVDGLSAALNVTFNVAIYDRRDGRVALELSDGEFHEHCYHMYLNWYRNFWALMDEVGLERSTAFRPQNQVVHLEPGTSPIARRTQTLTTLGDFSHAAENLLSGAAPAPDLFLWLYSMVDLVSHQFDSGRYLDRRSVHAFLASRWYATDECVRFHEHLLAKAFAVPTYHSSAYTYRKYVEYTLATPDPMLWVLKGDSQTELFEHFEHRLVNDKGLKIKRGLQVRSISWQDNVLRLKVRPSDILGTPRNPYTGRRPGDDDEAPADAISATTLSALSPDSIIVAVPPAALTRITGDFRSAVPGLDTVRKLQSAVTASLDLHFVRKLANIPPSHIVLRESALGLTIVDNAQAWDRKGEHGDPDPPTRLSVAVTDFYRIEGMDRATATAAIVEDLRRFIDFADEDIDVTRTYLQMNDGEPLFINEVGSEPWRPGTLTEIPGLFLAGDFCDNEIGVVTVEAAVVSGLQAARAVQAQLRDKYRGYIRADDPLLEEIPILMPETRPLVDAEAVKALLLPQAAMAYVASKQTEWAQHPERALSPRDLQFQLEQALQAAGAPAAILGGLAVRAGLWLADQHRR